MRVPVLVTAEIIMQTRRPRLLRYRRSERPGRSRVFPDAYAAHRELLEAKAAALVGVVGKQDALTGHG